MQADVAQLVEHSLGKGEVTSSILVIGSTKLRRFAGVSAAGARSRNSERSEGFSGLVEELELAGAEDFAEG